MIEDEELLSTLIQTEFAALSWDDSYTCEKGVTLVWPVLKKIVEKRLVSADDACHLMTAILLGKHELPSNCSSDFQNYIVIVV